jgi:hypothetical protein
MDPAGCAPGALAVLPISVTGGFPRSVAGAAWPFAGYAIANTRKMADINSDARGTSEVVKALLLILVAISIVMKKEKMLQKILRFANRHELRSSNE